MFGRLRSAATRHLLDCSLDCKYRECWCTGSAVQLSLQGGGLTFWLTTTPALVSSRVIRLCKRAPEQDSYDDQAKQHTLPRPPRPRRSRSVYLFAGLISGQILRNGVLQTASSGSVCLALATWREEVRRPSNPDLSSEPRPVEALQRPEPDFKGNFGNPFPAGTGCSRIQLHLPEQNYLNVWCPETLNRLPVETQLANFANDVH